MTVLDLHGKPVRQSRHDIVAAMNSPRLFGRWFPGPTRYNWCSLLKGAFALSMSDSERAFFRSVAGRAHGEKQNADVPTNLLARRKARDETREELDGSEDRAQVAIGRSCCFQSRAVRGRTRR
jgi:hypothetical protein